MQEARDHHQQPERIERQQYDERLCDARVEKRSRYQPALRGHVEFAQLRIEQRR
jgi:hypothetical protein